MTVTASNFARKENDLYETEVWATEALLRILPVDLVFASVWEPSAGNHKIVNVLKEAGARVFYSDITVYDQPHQFTYDFLSKTDAPIQADHIITNPPYGKGNRDAVQYARLALKRCDGWVALLLTAKFDFGSTRRDLFQDNARFYGKVALVDRISWAGNGETGTEDHAWYIWAPRNHAVEWPRMFYEGKRARLAA